MKKWIIIIASSLIALSSLFLYEYGRFHDGLLHVVFCNVGQGDAIFIRTPNAKNILVDAGPDSSVINCLSRHLPFWERTIHQLILTHPHNDHYFGMYYVIDRYHSLIFDTDDLFNKTAEYSGLMNKITAKKLSRRVLFAGDLLKIGEVNMNILAPSKEYLDYVSPNRIIAEKGEQSALVSLVTYGSFDLLLTSDNQAAVVRSALKGVLNEIEVLQVPHHGSKTGLTEELVKYIHPVATVISVGKNNYGHPSKEIIKILRDLEIRILRTDEVGDVEIVSDGKDWWVRK